MNAKSRQYLFGLLFVAFGVYQLIVEDMLEFSLYGMAGASFIVNAMTMEPALSMYKKPLVVASWLLIGATGILFLYMLQFKYL